MRATLIKLTLAAASLGSVALASALDHDSSNVHIFRRQAFDPDEETASGSTCVEAFGPGYIECAPATATKNRLCIIPSEGEICCDNKWAALPDPSAWSRTSAAPTVLTPPAAPSRMALSSLMTSSPAVPPTPPPRRARAQLHRNRRRRRRDHTLPTKGSGSSPTGGSGAQTPPVQVGGAATREGVSALIALAGLAVAVL
ncbi:unnamed protein product [Parascedosporium putredinis]|uniref:Uncharacterized protein n=1 Tax=Parascedosporium putredinis TaxID=1442378 RepID=A0A9P1M650_9PEZI|nr:unnamed protein product [Parascedosporium putredinis]CAI7988015.1 unnamed protein product [Parascedosporium putredinis]